MFATLSDKTICLRETCFYFMQCLKTLSLSNNNNSILDISLLPGSAGSGIKAINIIGHKEESDENIVRCGVRDFDPSEDSEQMLLSDPVQVPASHLMIDF